MANRINDWTAEELSYLRANYSIQTSIEIAEHFNNARPRHRSADAVRKKARLIGLARPKGHHLAAPHKEKLSPMERVAIARSKERIAIAEHRRPHCAATTQGNYVPRELSYRGQL